MKKSKSYLRLLGIIAYFHSSYSQIPFSEKFILPKTTEVIVQIIHQNETPGVEVE